MNFLLPLYPWIKSFHVISMVAWMAGMFYLPRLFVYHCDTKPGSTDSERFKVMEYRLLKQIINPAMIATFAFGILLILTPGVITLDRGLVVRETDLPGAADRPARCDVEMAARVHGGSQYTIATVLSDRQRNTDRPAGGDRDHGGRAPVLSMS